MGKKKEPPPPTGGLDTNFMEKRLCNFICLFQLVAIISGVALLYLSVIVVSPSKMTLDAEFNPETVVCTTLENEDSNDCDVLSCGEWCMSKASSCPIIWAKVREAGSTVRLKDCEMREEFCSAQEFNQTQQFTCSAGDETGGQCDNLERFMDCRLVANEAEDIKDNTTSRCRNITNIRECTSESGQPATAIKSCSRYTCNNLDGIYECSAGNCKKLINPRCVDRCSQLEMGNIAVVEPDVFHWGRCRAVEVNGTQIWSDAQQPLAMYCTSMTNVSGGEYEGIDCLNGTLVNRGTFSGITNYKQILTVLHDNTTPLSADNTHLASEMARQIFNRSKVMINIEGCVNTLQQECTGWLAEKGRDGSEGRHPAVYPCFTTPHSKKYVVTNYNRDNTIFALVLASAVPAALMIFSCCCLCLCGKTVGVNQYGLFFCKACHKEEGDGGKQTEKQRAA